MIGEISQNEEERIKSDYQPSDAVKKLTSIVKKDYADGMQVLTKPWRELNDRSILEDMNRGQAMFNAYVDQSYDDPNEAWEWRGTLSMARKKAIVMHTQITANYLLPLFEAQNDEQEIDKDYSEVMRHLIEWMAQPTNSDYQSSFLQIVFGMITDPVIYMGADFFEIMQMIKVKTDNGRVIKREILDEVMSGFKCPIFQANEILRPNAFERNIQKQRSIIKRRFVEYNDIEAKYGKHPNWQYVEKGIKSIYNEDDGTFYDIRDDDHPHLLAEEIWLHRRQDMEVPFINGIYMGEEDIDANLIKHRDNFNAPKYNVVPFGYYPIGNHFAFYKSLMNTLGWDNMLIDAIYEVGMNEQILRANMPIVVSGSDQVDSSIVAPKVVAAFNNPDVKATPLLPPRSNNILAEAKPIIEDSISESSANETLSGQLPEASQKAFTVAQAQANAKTVLRGVGKSLGASVVQYGDLMKDIVINKYTIAQIDELVGGSLVMSYKRFFLKGDNDDDRDIVFDKDLIGSEMSDEQIMERNIREAEKLSKKFKKPIDKIKADVSRVNPELFARHKFLTKVDVEEMFKKGQEYWAPILMELKSILANDPFIDQEKLTRELMYNIFQSKGDKFVKDQPGQLPGGIELNQGRSQLGQQVKQKRLQPAVQESTII